MSPLEKRKAILVRLSSGTAMLADLMADLDISRTQICVALRGLLSEGAVEVAYRVKLKPVYQLAFHLSRCEDDWYFPPNPLETVRQSRIKATPGMVPVNPDRWLSAWSGAHA